MHDAAARVYSSTSASPRPPPLRAPPLFRRRFACLRCAMRFTVLSLAVAAVFLGSASAQAPSPCVLGCFESSTGCTLYVVVLYCSP